MRVLVAGNKERGVASLQALLDTEHDVIGVIGHQPTDGRPGAVAEAGRAVGVPVLEPAAVNDTTTLDWIRALAPDLLILAGYSQILGADAISAARLGTINMHAGKLPEYRGSSPLNWALINGEREFTLSLIQADPGVDTGDILAERTFPIAENDTIADLHEIANDIFPRLLLEVLDALEAGAAAPRRQGEEGARYWPLRFPDDGLVVWDVHTAEQAHNRIRALTDPYPGAFTFWDGRRIRLLASRRSDRRVLGEPGRVYRVGDGEALVCAADECLWITHAVFDEDGADALGQLPRYATLATVRGLVLAEFSS